ncbi:amino acid permease [Jatrophihabitans sp. YIM 134969]
MSASAPDPGAGGVLAAPGDPSPPPSGVGRDDPSVPAPTPPSKNHDAIANLVDIPERTGYRIKRVLLGPPLVTAKLHEEKLSKKVALGVLSSDCISSSAYGTEQILLALLVAFGLSGFQILLPMTAVVLVVLLIMTLSYREVVMIYTRAGGSYVVARDNFNRGTAQLAAVALLIDYIVTVAVQSSACVAAVTSLAPTLDPVRLEMTVVIVLVLAYANLRGLREAGRVFAFPTYFFVISVGSVIIIGIIREILGDLPVYDAGATEGMIKVLDEHNPILSGAAIFVLLRAFANGGASLTGLEAISDSVSAFQKPNGPNARRTLSIMSLMLGSLVAGISWLAYETHATPYESGSPTVLSQVAKAAFGDSVAGRVGFAVVQIATALILLTGANTPFTGFPFLANFVAEDSFLPRQLTRRGHRLAFSNGIIVLTIVALVLVVVTRANVNLLVPLYAIGVFTGFALAGYGMAKYHTIHKEPGWKKKFWVNLAGGVVSTLVVGIFAVVKFTEGAWVVIVAFPILWYATLRLNRQYRRESRALDLVTSFRKDGKGLPHYPRHVVLVAVDRLDLAVLRAVRYAGSLRPTEIRAVHIMLDNEVAQRLERSWIERGLGDRVPLEIVECQDRRLIRASTELALRTVIQDHAEVTVLLPRRTFPRLSSRLLHDRTADRIAEAVGRIPHVAATIVPFDTTLDPAVEDRMEEQQERAAQEKALPPTRVVEEDGGREAIRMEKATAPAEPRADGTSPIGSVSWRQRVVVEGRITAVQIGTSAGKSLEAQLFDDTGGVRLLFMGRTSIPGIEPGTWVRAKGTVGEYKGHLALANPTYELVDDPASVDTETSDT